jgi:hypothetical protein
MFSPLLVVFLLPANSTALCEVHKASAQACEIKLSLGRNPGDLPISHHCDRLCFPIEIRPHVSAALADQRERLARCGADQKERRKAAAGARTTQEEITSPASDIKKMAGDSPREEITPFGLTTKRG